MRRERTTHCSRRVHGVRLVDPEDDVSLGDRVLLLLPELSCITVMTLNWTYVAMHT
jgi:hypothetical protein